jgi:pectin methylesterase-like acyl-CoA thioesterase
MPMPMPMQLVLSLLPFCLVAAAAVQPGDYLAVPGGSIRIDAVVSPSRQPEQHVFRTISSAVDGAPAGYVVYVTRGVYNEHVAVASSRLTLVGEGMGATFITGNRTNKTEGVHSNADTATLGT